MPQLCATMGLFDKISYLFNGGKPRNPNIPFGRFSDAYKSEGQIEAFEQSLERFDQGERLEAYRLFLQSLKDAQADNIAWEEGEGALRFHFWQGSQRIEGTASHDKVRVESKVARVEDLHVAFMRRLMEANFQLKFSRFALNPDNCLTIVFDSNGTDASPLKLQNALRELAVQADKQDDLLLEEFKNLRAVEQPDLNNIPESEKQVKYQFIQSEIRRVFDLLDKKEPDANRFPGTYAYLLLGTAFKLDYLVKPEGFTMEVLEKVYKIYFAQNDRNAQMKIAAIRKELQLLLDRSEADFFKEMYRTASTFGVSPAVNQTAIVNLIENELPNIKWPLQQNHPELALAVPQYIIGFALFHYSPPKPVRDLFHLFYECTEPQFFQALGFQTKYGDGKGHFDKVNIRNAIKTLAKSYRHQYPLFKPDVDGLDFASAALFAQSYLAMIKNLNLKKTE